jgi:DNA helicase-2/ATP-dependent DNA helicase PcrA
MTTSFLEGLNPPQHEAVTLPRQSALILAGAGSGKTRVLTTRIAWLIATGQASPHGLLAVTFTNKAAREMLTRVSAMLPINTRGMWVGTFHGLCNRLLRAHWREAGLSQLFTILDSQDQLSLVKRLMKSLNVDDEKYPVRQVQYFINGNKEEGLRPSAVEPSDDLSRRLLELYGAYEDLCRREGVVDFAELLLRSYELLAQNEVLRDHYRARFQHILVDELQDTNRLQYQWLRLLAGASNAVFAVGDDDQSIYAFRGAHSANMQQFERDFAVERVIKLEQNYRSHGNILDAANALIRQNRTRLGKNLWTSEGAGEPLRLYQASTDTDEAAFIVDEIRMLRSDGVPLTDIALLYRSNAQSRVLEHALFSAALPYRVYGGLRFFERQEVKHALAYLRLIANPDDDGALLRVINFPPRGIGARTLEQLQETAQGFGGSLWQAACRRGGKGTRPALSGKGVEGFVLRIEELRVATEGLPLPETIEHVIETSGLAGHYKAERDGADRLENLAELVNAAAAFVTERGRGLAPAGAGFEADEAGAPETELMAFLNHAALEAGERQAGAGTDCVQLMTVHSAKGLEFHTVFISGLEEGLFPHENSLTEAGGIEEERRLMYVALTRARRRLYLSFAQSRMLHGQTRYHIASRFLQEIPAELMKRVGAFAVEAPPARSYAGSIAAAARPAPFQQRQPLEESGLRVGQSVHHPKFGPGVIVGAEGRGGDARVQVSFRNAGVKWLALEFAKLTPA